ncbi:hypothetical protein GGS23DRAFT_322430 [Durotheca rogersii]|uniref:uncharacterized protein n=1 Tax=Durotheca rogersii TaxID=419775 RepID=UPI00221ED44B|nr:uncharacterized protein GGS23DRAFT_322430 [Durotheca rogersii]KAI5859330.1 hypothetical protein GGS23DRAFT_322430 [Durotheca rogersii]
MMVPTKPEAVQASIDKRCPPAAGGCGSRSGNSSGNAVNSAGRTPASAATPSKQTVLHAHRQSHNSSKLPAFRFADLKREPIVLPSLLQNNHHIHHIPPSPVSPDPDQHPDAQPNATQETPPPPVPAHLSNQHLSHTSNTTSARPGPSVSRQQLISDRSPSPRSRASTFQNPTTLSTAKSSTASVNVKRSASLGSSAAIATTTITNGLSPNPAGIKSPSDSADTLVTVRQHPRHRRAPLSAGSATTLDTPSGKRMHAAEDNPGASPGEEISKEGAHGQRELLLPKTIQRTTADERRNSVARRPPISYKAPVTSASSGGTASIPPIRSFRSSGERRSLVLDMNVRSMRSYDGGDDYGDSNHRDRTLRALEGRRFDDVSQITPPDSAGDRPDVDENGDLFLKIAREDPLRRSTDSTGTHGENSSALSRVTRTSRRPLSIGVSSYQPASPPQMSRRLSDQETSRSRGFSDEQSGERIARTLTYRGPSRDKSLEETKSKANSAPLRASPLTTPRSSFPDAPPEQASAAYGRKRQMSIDNGTPGPSRVSSLKLNNVNYSHPRGYSSSPLVQKPMESQKNDTQQGDTGHGVEGTDSTASTAAPSTVWDELDDLKSRIHRLELTGKLPPTSGAAISRASEERPPTANTNATTLSASPKRGSGGAAQASDSNIPQRDSHPLLHSALLKSKEFISTEAFEALETAANDALSLSSMMGIAGQPGPISSGASSIGSGTTITDRQLRRKADSICRSLTELCLALSEGVLQAKSQQVVAAAVENPPMASPTITKFPGMSNSRRPSLVDRNLAVTTSPRAPPRYEERRNSAISSSVQPTPRYSNTLPVGPNESTVMTGRKTSMLLSRTRRIGSEEPEEGRKSSLLRTRRATTEEPEDMSDRKPIIIRGRQGTVENEEEESRFRAPSRAITEVQGHRSVTREYASQLPAPPSKEQETLASSALPRRRLGSALNTRLVLPATTTGIATPIRRYFERSTPDREAYSPAEKIYEGRPQRQFSIARPGSIDKRANRDSMIASAHASGTYR